MVFSVSKLIVVLGLGLCSFTSFSQAKSVEVHSPDGKISVLVSDANGVPNNAGLEITEPGIYPVELHIRQGRYGWNLVDPNVTQLVVE